MIDAPTASRRCGHARAYRDRGQFFEDLLDDGVAARVRRAANRTRRTGDDARRQRYVVYAPVRAARRARRTDGIAGWRDGVRVPARGPPRLAGRRAERSTGRPL